MTTDDTLPQWAQDDQANIAAILEKAEAARADALDQENNVHRVRLNAEADLHEQDATLAQALLDARLSGDDEAKLAASIAYTEFRQFWRSIRDIRTSGNIHIFAAVAAEQEG